MVESEGLADHLQEEVGLLSLHLNSSKLDWAFEMEVDFRMKLLDAATASSFEFDTPNAASGELILINFDS